jgi:hypothetical protein
MLLYSIELQQKKEEEEEEEEKRDTAKKGEKMGAHILKF